MKETFFILKPGSNWQALGFTGVKALGENTVKSILGESILG